MRWRLLSASIIISILLVLGWLDANVNFGRPGIWVAPLGILVAGLAAGEMLALFRAQNHHPVAWTTIAGTMLVMAAACAPMLWRDYPADCPLGKFGWPLSALALSIVLAFWGEMRRYKKPGGAIVNVALSVFVMAYIGGLMSFLAALRMFHDNAWGMAALLSVMIIVKVSDSGAYAVGRTWGRHKMSPILSPKKTIEGAIGGIVTACLTSLVLFRFLDANLGAATDAPTPILASLIYGLVIAIAGMIGDLAESLLKRDADIKDSSKWLPGLGGVLDILDSVLTTAPAAFVCWAIGLVGPGAAF